MKIGVSISGVTDVAWGTGDKIEQELAERRDGYRESKKGLHRLWGIHSTSIRANSILNDENREFVSSQFVKLEVLPKAIYHQQQDETDFYETFFSAVSHWATDSEQITQDAY